MYTPPAFQETDPATLQAMIRAARLATLVTHGPQGLLATPLPLLLAAEEGAQGVLYGHLARANEQWRQPLEGEALAVFMGPDAYVSPSWYPSKREHGRAVPTWNYLAVHAYGPVEFFEEEERLLAVVRGLTQRHEAGRPDPWSIEDAPPAFLKGQLRGIVGLRLPIARLEGKRKLSQNRPPEDQAGVVRGLSASADPADRALAALMTGKS